MQRLFDDTTSAERLRVRRRVFAQQDGLALVPVLAAFSRRRVFEALERGVDVTELARMTSARRGYLNIVLRALASSGWLEGWRAPHQREDLDQAVPVRLTPAGRHAATVVRDMGSGLDRLDAFLTFAEHAQRYFFSEAAAPEGVPSWTDMAKWCRAGFGLPTASNATESGVLDRLRALFEGGMAAPLAVALARHRLVATAGTGRQVEVGAHLQLPPMLGPVNRRRFRLEVAPALDALGWYDAQSEELTTQGRLIVFFAPAYAVTLSYLPLLRRAEELIFRHARFARMFPPTAEGHETHVDRRLNIWGSGGSHALYFSKVDEVVARLFTPEDYPRAICDTGCGDGSFLRHMAEILRDRLAWDFFTRPVAFIGSDLNLASREKTRETLAAAGVPHAYVVDEPIDINDPDRLDAAIRALGIETDGDEPNSRRPLTAADALHTNSMLIHNRTYAPANVRDAPSTTDGAFVDPEGHAVVGEELQANLVSFMQRWSPYVRRHGWLFIELHTLPAPLVAADPSRTPTIAYDLTHGFSNQYTVERAELLAAAAHAGLAPGPSELQALFPAGALARISVTYLVGE